MNEESRNWFRLSKLIIDSGAEVLQRLVVENIQTSFLNELVYSLLAKVNRVKDENYAKTLWNSFRQDLTDMDKTCEIQLRHIHNNWKLRENQKLTFPEQVPTLQKWANDIETSLKPFLKKQLTDMDKKLQLPENQTLKWENYSETPFSTKLLRWLEQVHNSMKNLNFISYNLQYLNTSFLELCQQSQKNLLKEITNHCDDFLSSSIFKVSRWDVKSKEEMKDHLTNLESDRKKMLESWKNVSDRYVKSLGQNIKNVLVSLERRAPNITGTPQLKQLCSDLKATADQIDGTELQKSCDTWHKQMHDLIDTWLVKTNSVQPSSHICTDFLRELKRFTSISSKQVYDFFLSKIEKKEFENLKERRKISEEQFSKLSGVRTLQNLQTLSSTLLVIVLRSYLLYPPTYGWSEDPPEFDQSLSAEIVRLKSFRNIIIEHSEKTSISQPEFDRLWLSAKQVLCRLAAGSGSGHEYETEVSRKVDHLKTCSFSPAKDSEFRRILDFCRNDILAEFKGLARTHQCLHILDTVEKAELERSSRENAERNRQQEQERNRQQEQERRRLQQEQERLRREHELERLRQELELERLRQELELERNRHLREQKRLRQELELERNRHQQDQERLGQQQEQKTLFPTSIPEGVRAGLDASDGPITAVSGVVGGAVLGLFGGIGRTLFKK